MSTNNPFFTEDDCLTILRNNLKKKDPIVKSFSITSLSGNEGMSGQHLIVLLTYQDDVASEAKTKRYFLKVLNNSYNILFDMCISLNAYGKEEFFYNVLIKELKINGIEASFAPRSVLCKPYTIVLEDLSIHGYKNSPKKEMFDVEHCKLALKCLAKFHGSIIAYEQKKIKEIGKCDIFEKHKEYLDEKFFTDVKNHAKVWLNTTMDALFEIIKIIPEKEGITSEKFISTLSKEIENCNQRVSATNKHKNCILHRDLWTNNFLLKYENDKPVDCILIDYQLLKYGPLALDPVQMLVTNLRRKPRDENFHSLLEFYYENFDKTLSKYGQRVDSVFSLKDFISSCEDMKIPAKLHATAGHTLTFLTDKDVEEGFKSEEATEHFLFGDKRNTLMKSYQTNDLLREILLEDLLELRDFLFGI